MGGICKESGNETVVHSVYSPPHALMHNGNAPVEWEGKLEYLTTWDTVPLGVNYLSVETQHQILGNEKAGIGPEICKQVPLER